MVLVGFKPDLDNQLLSVLWHCSLGHLACKNCPQNDLYCVVCPIRAVTVERLYLQTLFTFLLFSSQYLACWVERKPYTHSLRISRAGWVTRSWAKVIQAGGMPIYILASFKAMFTWFSTIVIYTVNQKTHLNVFCHIFYKTQPILIQFGTYYPE